MNRTDVNTAIVVNHGIAIAEMDGQPGRAAMYMAEKGVPFAVAHRVLLYPQRRRSYDWR